MTLIKTKSQYIAANEVSKPTRSGIMVISEMPTHRILGFVAYRHRVGLLLLGNLAFVSYFVYSKAVALFF